MKVFGLIIPVLLAGLLESQTLFSANAASYLGTLQNATPQSDVLAEASELTASAVKLYKERKYKQALKPATRALEIRELTLPADDRRVVDALGNLGAIHLALNNFKEAERLYKRILAADEKTAGAESLRVAKTLDVLASLHSARGNEDQAEAEYKRALAIKTKATGPESEEVARTLFRLAKFYQFRGKFEKAQPLYERLIAFDKKVLPETNETLSDALNAYACLLRKMNKSDEAQDLEIRLRGDPADLAAKGSNPSEGGLLNGKALSLMKPSYPAEARNQGASGMVVVKVTISEEGRVIHACAVSGHPSLWEVSERAAYASKFSPTLLSGKPIKVTGVITYNFRWM